MAAVLFDTCAMVFLANGETMAEEGRNAIANAIVGDGAWVSPISAWEIGMLESKGRIRFLPDVRRWLGDFLGRDGVGFAPLAPSTALEAGLLPSFRGDPADCILIATARHLDVPLVTRDRRILNYARAGHVKAVRC
jgi:PIN domain nuclease of toxin-antitoxin system